MPSTDRSARLGGYSISDLESLRRMLFSETLRLLQERLSHVGHETVDEAITVYIVTSICPSENAVHANGPYWLSQLKYLVKKLDLGTEDPTLDEEQNEERRRLWWASWIIDRHTALSFNLRTQLTDQDCPNLLYPHADEVWESDETLPLRDPHIAGNGHRTPYHTAQPDFFGLYIPFARILGEILEYHFLRQQLAFNSDPIFLTSIRNNIQSHLDEWSASFRKHDDLGILNHSTQTNVTTMTNQKCPPRLIYYGNHLFHCLHILLYGPMDLVSMFEDAEWQASPDFIKAGEHAMDCAKVARNILLVDPYLDTMFRFFGTYLLQSTFIFLLLAQKLGSSSDHLILDNCAINLQVLDVFTSVTNMDYQRTFATALRDTISNATDISNTSTSTTPPDERFPNTADNPPSRPQLHPDLLQYRWVGGAKGLWPV